MAMLTQNHTVDGYLKDGCGRCSDFQTPNCKVHQWAKELATLRQLVLKSGLTEEIKWGNPCYTDNGKNILMIAAFRRHAALSFFQGALLTDPKGLLKKPGENSRYSKLLIFTEVADILAMKDKITAWIDEAIQNSRSDKTVVVSKEIQLTDEMTQVFSTDPELEASFWALTPGRQRGYVLCFSQPKQEKTRLRRISKYRAKIINGKGWSDRE